MLVARIACVALCCAPAALAQGGTDPAFDVVSVKALGPNIHNGPGPGMMLGLRRTPTRISGKSQIPALITEAYSLKPFQLILPDIPNVGLNVYEVEAVMPVGTAEEEKNGMLRTMLAERFGLQFHRETREIPVYVLTVASGKPKLQAVDLEEAKGRLLQTPLGPRKAASAGGSGWLAATHMTMEVFAANIGLVLECPVVDQTGLNGSYLIDLHWDQTDPFDLVSAVQRQLGLKLRKNKMPYELFVVDHVSPTPTPN
jgi:uncharacterized protein (TIGR03435 family)